MPKYTGALRKMSAQYADPIAYALCFANQQVPLNPSLGKRLSLNFSGNIFCIQCDRKISKTFQQGYCFPCYKRLLECNLCIIHPERCLVEQKPCPANDWAHAQCAQTQIVYLSNTSGLKVGVTRETQVPTRWIDQGAVQAVPLLKVSNRYRAGLVEVALKAFIHDKTNWRAMLKNQVPLFDLDQERQVFLAKVQSELTRVTEPFIEDVQYLDQPALALHYPVLEYPHKVSSLSLDKTPQITATLLGIKGQYLLLDTGVINLRKFGGYEITVEWPC